MVFVRQMYIDSEAGQAALKQVQKVIDEAQIDKVDVNGNINYLNQPLDDLVRPLLTSLKLEHYGYKVWKIKSPISFYNSVGPGYIIPVLRTSGTNENLTPSSYIYHEGPISVSPGLTCLVVGPPQRRG
ncbi:hypothetical protein BJX76DRAFT_221117 [Aspergillus varians]